MTIKTVLLPIRESDNADFLMETSISLAKRNNAHLDLLYVQSDPEQLLPFATLGLSAGMRQSIINSATAAATSQGELLEQRFLALSKRYSVAIKQRGSNPRKPSAAFLICNGARDELIAQYGRLADLVVMPQPLRTSPPPSSFEAALRETGRPVLMVPRAKVWDTPGRRLAIGWNSSKEASQAIAAVLPTLQEAEQVYVLCSEKRMQQTPNADDVCLYLHCHGVTAETAVFSTDRQSVGAALLAKTHELECDRLVVGGYSRPKIRDLIMGGVTGFLLERADLPVLMVH